MAGAEEEMKLPERDLVFVFDVAGVLVRWDPLAVYRELLEQDGARIGFFFERVLSNERQARMSAGESMQSLLREAAAEHPDYREAVLAWRERWHEMLTGELAGTVSVLGELQERGYRTCALGNWSREEFEWALPRFAFLSTFDDVLLSGDCGVLKPDPRIYRLAERRFDLVPGRTVFIDDRADNVEAALAAGWNGLVFEDARQLYLVLMDYGVL